MAIALIAGSLLVAGVALLILSCFSTLDLAATCARDPRCPPDLPRRVLHAARNGAGWEVSISGLTWGISGVLILLGFVAVGWGWAANAWLWAALTLDLAFWSVIALAVFVRRRVRG